MKRNFKPDKYRDADRKHEPTLLTKKTHDAIDLWSISLLNPGEEDYTNNYVFSVDTKPKPEYIEQCLNKICGFPVTVNYESLRRTLYYKRNSYYVRLGSALQWRQIMKITREVLYNVYE